MSDKEPDENASDGLEAGISRREWLMKLGESSALVFGFSGAAAGRQAKTATPASAIAADQHALPPGLYEPSGEHMARALINDERYVKIPAGSETDYVRPRQEPFHPVFFDHQEFQAIQQLLKLILGPHPEGAVQAHEDEGKQTIAEIAEWIDLVASQASAARRLARAISPQHRALAMAYYGKEAVEKLETDDPGETCRDGLKWLNETSTKLHGAPFLELSESAQIEVAGSAADAETRAGRGNTGSKFLTYLISQTVLGWYTSRLGIRELGYKGNSFSVECPGCEPS